ncbi:regulator of Vps4 activity in the MVB pathway-domain-containing protein [Schizophyllum amplum]|uniref:Regulator of Vps4 activity in the MVB pathway-domain-containing protein n=1 Tax=Schizophyllum amplum TaxID=97359 RepID=A0A550C9Q7_9AGAR|nr:regulator of Vps4 activity in the MVB pathway-domain-containing protein [Auriculariopsis ampla]
MAPWNSAKAKVGVLSVQRLRSLQQKKEAQAKATRRDIATLLERGKVETARIKTEAVINEDIHLELLELLELYCELVHVRFGILDQNNREPDPAVAEGVHAYVINMHFTELHILRDLLMHKYGREFSVGVMENRDGCVPERVVRKLELLTPNAELVDGYLHEIAKAYAVQWAPPVRESATDDDDDDGGIGVEVSDDEADLDLPDALRAAKAKEATEKAKEHKEKEEQKAKAAAEKATTKEDKPPPEDDFEALSRRFAALKKR